MGRENKATQDGGGSCCADRHVAVLVFQIRVNPLVPLFEFGERVNHFSFKRARCGLCDGSSDNLCLYQERLFARVDQTLAKLVEIEHARDKNQEGNHLKNHNAAGET